MLRMEIGVVERVNIGAERRTQHVRQGTPVADVSNCVKLGLERVIPFASMPASSMKLA